jgi:23S rRNA pseudouridine1911/1915/1917 synthase
MSFRNFHIDDRLDGASLAQALKSLVPNTSWTQAKRLIANRHVQVHGNLCLDEGRRLKSGDVVKVWDEPLGKPPEAEDIPIVYRDAHLVVVEKPAGITTQREAREISSGREQKQATLDELLQAALAKLPALPTPRAAPVDTGFIVKRKAAVEFGARPAIAKVRPVHRLDRDTSGLMLFALSPEAEQKLSGMFKRHEIERVYRAVVIGRLSEPMTIESDFVRDRGDGLRGSTTDKAARDRQHAITHVKPIEQLGDAYTIVECRLETGRTHQIRIHLADRGHMLCGEKMYTKPVGGKPTRDASNAPRHALHSATLSLKHPISGQPLTFTSDWPRDLKRWLDALRLQA